MSKSDFSGYWRITHTSVWDQEAMDLVAPAHLSFSDRRVTLLFTAEKAEPPPPREPRLVPRRRRW